jgi:hypothetical protein
MLRSSPSPEIRNHFAGEPFFHALADLLRIQAEAGASKRSMAG